MDLSPSKLLSGCALLLGVGAVLFAAVPMPVDDQPIGAWVTSSTGQVDRPRLPRPEPPARLDLSSLPAGATVRDALVVQPPQESERLTGPLALTLRVDVQDREGRPVPRAIVVYYQVVEGAFPREERARCDAEGRFESARLADGLYRVRVEAEGYSTSSATELRIPRRMGEPLSVVLAPAGP